MKKQFFIGLLLIGSTLISNAQGFDLSNSEAYNNFSSLFTTGFSVDDASIYKALNTSIADQEDSVKISGSSVSFYYKSSQVGKCAFKVYEDYIQPNGDDRTIKITNLKMGSKITLTCKSYNYDVNFNAINADKISYKLSVTSGDTTLTLYARDTCVSLVNTSGKYKLQKIAIENTDSVIPEPTFKAKRRGFDFTKGGLYYNFKYIVNGTFAKEDSTTFYYLKMSANGDEEYFTIKGSSVIFFDAGHPLKHNVFKAYDTYVKPCGTDRKIRIPNLTIGEKISLTFKGNYEAATLSATGAQQTSFNLATLPTATDTTITLIATDTCITLKNTDGEYKLQKVYFEVDVITDPKINYNINDTNTYYVSDVNFEKISPKVYLESTENLIASVGGGDSIINHYSEYIYDANVHGDTLIIDKTINELSAPDNNVSIKIYPNPAKDYVIVDIDDYSKINNYTVKIVTATGQTVYSSLIISNAQSINVQNLGGTGLYYIIFEDTNNNTFVTKQLLVK